MSAGRGPRRAAAGSATTRLPPPADHAGRAEGVAGTEAGRKERIRSVLQAAFSPQRLVIEDESHKHKGHAGAATGRGHFSVEIVAAAFNGKSALVRHRMVYEALGDLMQSDIHALSIQARTPDEARD